MFLNQPYIYIWILIIYKIYIQELWYCIDIYYIMLLYILI